MARVADPSGTSVEIKTIPVHCEAENEVGDTVNVFSVPNGFNVTSSGEDMSSASLNFKTTTTGPILSGAGGVNWIASSKGGDTSNSTCAISVTTDSFPTA